MATTHVLATTDYVIPIPPQLLLELRTQDPADAEALLASARAARTEIPAMPR